MKEKKMKYKSIKIENYKAIKKLEMDFKERTLIPFIGLNETGKSSILEAIFAFNSYNDNINNSKHISKEYVSNKYEVIATEPLITAKLEIRKEIKEEIVKKFIEDFYYNYSDEEKKNLNERFIQLLNEVCKENIIIIERNLFTKKYKIKSD
ncbi:MAG: AAA family ATPase, partial [Leptotrichia hongkongensis]